MFQTPTTFVIGAGASAELGMPVGAELKNSIAKKLDVKFSDGFRQSSGDLEIADAYRAKVQAEGHRDINGYRAAGCILSDALPLAISIDNLLEAHADDPKKVFCGKLGIVKCILDAERGTPLQPRRNDSINFADAGLQSAWLTSLHRFITESVSAKDLERSLSKLSFVIFNYDRCVETFLHHSFQQYYRMSGDSAAGLLNQVQFVHPYGTVGRLPWQAGMGAVVDFGAEASREHLVELSTSIKIFTERLSESFEDLVSHLSDEAFVFLGFAYHPQNLELIRRLKVASCKRILGTTLGFSDSDCVVIRNQLAAILKNSKGPQSIELSAVSCAQLFLNHSKSITQ